MLISLLLGLAVRSSTVALAGGLQVDGGEVEISTASADAVAAGKAALAARDFEQAASLYHALFMANGGVQAALAEAVARYESGDLRGAKVAVEAGLTLAPKDVASRNLLGLILIDGGAVESGIKVLNDAAAAARANGDSGAQARIALNLALAALDQGRSAEAKAGFEQARVAAQSLGDGALAGAAAQGAAAAAGLSGSDAGVGALLGRGDIKGALAEAKKQASTATVRRQKINAELDLAAVERAQGNLDGSVVRLKSAIDAAREAGMMREVTIGLGNLGLAYTLLGQHPLAADSLKAGINEASKSGYRVVEVDLRCELGFVLLHMQNVGGAGEQQRSAGALLAKMDYAAGVARQAELGGAIASEQGDVATANQALGQAVDWYVAHGRPLDAARVATQLAAAWQRSDPAKAESFAKKAEGYFANAHDVLGPAHVALARALADSRAKRLPEALAGFANAAKLGEATGTAGGAALARVAREDAASTLVALGAGQDIAALASKQGLGDLVTRATAMQAAFATYDAGLKQYEGRMWAPARASFAAAQTAFAKLNEAPYATRAHRAAVWSDYNATITLPVAQAVAAWARIVPEAGQVEDPELYTRSYGAAAVAIHQSGQGDPSQRLSECVRRAASMGLADVEARCQGAIAERAGDLDVRARAARAANALMPADAGTVYALYSVAVDAYNADRSELARELATLARPNGGALAAQLEIILKGTAP
jgi:tetratricopeptide (TPR) repeat protein